MRVTPRMYVYMMQQNISVAQKQFYTASYQASTTKKLKYAADDPTLASYQMNSNMALDDIDHFLSTNAVQKERLDNAESALSGMTDIFQRLKEIFVSSASGQYNSQNRITFADEVASLKAHFIQTANMQADGSFVFAGFKTESAPFDATGQFVGDANEREAEVSKGLFLSVGTPGSRYLTELDGGINLFKVFDTLESGLRSNDIAKIKSASPLIDQGLSQLTSARIDVSGKIGRLDLAAQTLEENKNLINDSRSQFISVDPIEAIATLKQVSDNYKASVQIAAKTLNISILEYMK